MVCSACDIVCATDAMFVCECMQCDVSREDRVHAVCCVLVPIAITRPCSKVILAHGRVMAIGTSKELKRDWGVGYWIHVQAKKENSRLVAEENLKKVRDEVIAPILGGAQVVTKNRMMNEYYLSYCIPWGKENLMPKALDALHAQKDKFGETGRGSTTMGEVLGSRPTL